MPPLPASASPSRAPGRLATFAGLAVLAAAVLAAYGNSFRVPFVFDDGQAIQDNPSIRRLWDLRGLFSPPPDSTVGGRPVANVTLAINYAVSGTDVWSYHALNLLILFLGALALFGITRRTLLMPGLRARFGRDAVPVAFATALLWSLHPLQTEAVTYVVQRVESLAGLFYLLTLYCFIRSTEAQRPLPWQACAVVACLLGMGAKETMVTAPLLVLLYDRTFVAGSFRGAWSQRPGLYLGLAATWLPLPFLVAATGWSRAGTAGFNGSVSPLSYWLTQVGAVARYLRLCVWPSPLVFDYGPFLVRGPSEVVPSALAVGLLALATLAALRRSPALGFLGAWFFAILAPTLLVPVATQTLAEHRMYLPLAPVILLLVLGIRSLGGAGGWRFLVPLAALGLGLGFLTSRRNDDYRSELALWTDTVAKRPGNERAQNNLGFLLAKIPGRLDEAIAHYDEALRLKPDFVQAHSNLGGALVEIPGRRDEAIAQYEDALRLDPAFAQAHFNLACVLEKVPGRGDEALAQYREAVRLDPGFVAAHFNLGCLLEKVPGRLDDAVAQYQEAVRLKPDFAEARYNLGCALEKIPGRMDEAIAQYRETLRLQPGHAEAHFNLGGALDAIPGRLDEAVSLYEEGLRLKPDFAPAHFKLGCNLERIPGRLNGAIAQFEEALRLDTGYAEAHFSLGFALERVSGRLNDAIFEYAEALRLKPDYAAASNNLGIVLCRTGRIQDGIGRIEDAIRMQPGFAQAHFALGAALLQIGRPEEALSELNRGLQLQPGDRLARRLVDWIQSGAQAAGRPLPQ
jgi:tetratricopeptide (TPR) repeat protein